MSSFVDSYVDSTRGDGDADLERELQEQNIRVSMVSASSSRIVDDSSGRALDEFAAAGSSQRNVDVMPVTTDYVDTDELTLKERALLAVQEHPRRVYGAGACCCVCLLLVVILGSLFGTVAQTSNANIVSFTARFDELCVIADDALPAKFHIELDNPSSIGVGVDPFTLQMRRLADNVDESDGELVMTMDLPEIEVPGGSGGIIDFEAAVKFVDLVRGQKLASDFLSGRDIVMLLVAEVGVTALGVGTSVDLRLPFYFNDTQNMRDPNGEQALSIANARIGDNTADVLELGIDLRINGSDRFIAQLPTLNLAMLYTATPDDELMGDGAPGETRAVANVRTEPLEFKEGWNMLAAPTTVPAANVTFMAHAFKRYMGKLPLDIGVRGGGGNPECWLQRFVDGMLIERSLDPTPADGKPLYNRVALNMQALRDDGLAASVELDLAKELNVEGQIPPLVVGIYNERNIQTRALLVAADVRNLTLDPGPNQFSLNLDVENNQALADAVVNIANGVPTELSLQLIGNNVLARIAAQYYVAAPFNGYVDPFATLTPPPTPPPPPRPADFEGGLRKVAVQSVNADTLRLSVDFELPGDLAVTWDPPAYTINMSPASTPTQTHGSFAIDARFAERLFSSTVDVRIWNYEDAARTINSIINGQAYQLLLRGDNSNDDMIGKFLAALKPITVSSDTSAVPTNAAARDAAGMAGGGGFEMLSVETVGFDGRGATKWALGRVAFALGIKSELDFVVSPPPQLSMLYKPPPTNLAARAVADPIDGTIKLLDVELRTVSGANNAYEAQLAATVPQRQHTDLALNQLLRSDGLDLQFTGTSTSNTLMAKLLQHVVYKVRISPPAAGGPPPGTMQSTADALLFGMKYESSSADEMTISTEFKVDVPIPMPVTIGDVDVALVYNNFEIGYLRVPDFRLKSGENTIKLSATLTAKQSRAMLEEGISSAIFPPAGTEAVKYLVRGTVRRSEWPQTTRIPLEFEFEVPDSPPSQNNAKNPNSPLKCTELDEMRICPGSAASDSAGCLSTESLQGGGLPPGASEKIIGLLSDCAIAADVSAYMQNPTTLDVRLEHVKARVQFDDPSGLPLPMFPRNKDNVLGTIDTDYAGALIKGRQLVHLPVTLVPAKDDDARPIEVCMRAGWNYFISSLITLDLLDVSVTLRLQNFRLSVRFDKRGIGIERVPEELKVQCVDYLASIQLTPLPLGPADGQRKRIAQWNESAWQ